VIAYVFHFPPSELWDMDGEEIVFWIERAKELNRK